MSESTDTSTATTPETPAAQPDRGPGIAQFAGMVGSSIAAKNSTDWVLHFLNAAYYAKADDDRELEDLRLAHAVLTTHWHRLGRRLRTTDVHRFHHAFRLARDGGSHYPAGRLDRQQLERGSQELHGDWFLEAYADPERRGWGVAFESVDQRDAYRPEARLESGALAALSPPVSAPSEQTWLAYEPVEVPSAERVEAALRRSETWQDYGSEIGRFTAVRSGGLEDQTFEIEVVAEIVPHVPMFTRGYVTVTQILDRSDPAALEAYIADINATLAEQGHGEAAVPEGASPALVVELTTHNGHFIGNAISRLMLYEDAGTPYLRDVGSWDPMPWYIRLPYHMQGEKAQHAFWGLGTPRQSMLHQIALATARDGRTAPLWSVGSGALR
jgi:hypothetical protein